MRGALPWIVAGLAVFAVWVDIPKHRFPFPFDYPGIAINFGPIQFEKEIKTHLGLDLQGGTQLVLRLKTEELTDAPRLTELNTQVRRTIDRRINELGVAEPVIQALGADKVIVELPGVADVDQATRVVTRTAFLEFKVPDDKNPGQFKSLEPPLTGANLKPTAVTFERGGQEPAVRFEFGGPDGQRWIDLTKQHVGKQVQIVLDGKEISSPVIREVFTSPSGVITGGFTIQQARELSLLLNSGALPVPLEVVQSTRVDPTLGQDSVQRSLVAGAAGLFLVAAFMVTYYRLPGVLAVVALLYYAALTYAIFRLVPVTLTLAGIAGFILSIGMAVDANILIFERLKEELRAGRSLRVAIEEGGRRAFPSIFFSNAATIITAVILFWLGTGTVKGFAFTLGIGVAVSFFTAVTVSQMLLRGAVGIGAFRARPLYGVEERAAGPERLEPARPKAVS